MNVYFACSITGGREHEAVYKAIVDALLLWGHQVPTAHLSRKEVMALETVVDARDVYARDIGWIEASDAVIAEVSTPSHGVGFEIAYALHKEKPVLCCHLWGVPVSKMITGNSHPNIQVRAYRDSGEVVKIICDYLHSLL